MWAIWRAVLNVMLIRPRSSWLTVGAIGIERGETNPTLGNLATSARMPQITRSRLLEGVD